MQRWCLKLGSSRVKVAMHHNTISLLHRGDGAQRLSRQSCGWCQIFIVYIPCYNYCSTEHYFSKNRNHRKIHLDQYMTRRLYVPNNLFLWIRSHPITTSVVWIFVVIGVVVCINIRTRLQAYLARLGDHDTSPAASVLQHESCTGGGADDERSPESTAEANPKQNCFCFFFFSSSIFSIRFDSFSIRCKSLFLASPWSQCVASSRACSILCASPQGVLRLICNRAIDRRYDAFPWSGSSLRQLLAVRSPSTKRSCLRWTIAIFEKSATWVSLWGPRKMPSPRSR